MFHLIAGALAEEATATDALEGAAEEAAEAAPNWFQTAFEGLGDFPLWAWIVVAVLLVGGFIVYRAVKGGKKTIWTTKMISMGAICMALSSVLSLIKIWEMPNGGSVTPASMLPMMLFAYGFGTVPGLALGAIYGFLQFLIGGTAWFLSVPQMLMDYPVAFAMVGLAGLFRKNKNEKLGLTLGVVVASFGRFVAAVVAGLIFWTDLTEGVMPAVIYSLGYNGSYMLPECIICVLLAVLMGPRLTRELKKSTK